MGIEPFQALTKAYKKYVVLFLALISSFLFVSGALAQEPQAPNEQDGKTITVRASVPLTPEFVFSIKKNSSVTLEKSVFVLDEEIRVQVKIAASNNFPLRNHKINLQVVNNKKEVSLVLFGETDNDGIALFAFIAGADLLGKHTLRVVDITYDKPIAISQEISFIVHKKTNKQREREMAAQKITDNHKLSEREEAMDVSISSNINNGTIVADFKKEVKQKWDNDP